MIWEPFHIHRIGASRPTSTVAEGMADRVYDQMTMLEDKIDSLSLVCQAMWEILSEKIPDADGLLAEHIANVDLRDGKLDGKMNRIQRKCSRCDRPLHKRHQRCIYCGNTMEQEHIFQK